MYAVILEPDDNGTILVTCPDLPEVTTFAVDEEDAMQRAADAIEEALAARIARHEVIPTPSEPARSPMFERRIGIPEGAIGFLTASETNRRMVQLPPLTMAKVELYRAACAQRVSKGDLARRLGWHGPQVDRLFDLHHRSPIEHVEQALRAIGKRLVVSVEDAA